MGIPAYFSHVIREYNTIIQTMAAVRGQHRTQIARLYLDSNSIIYDTVYAHNPDEDPAVGSPDYERHIITQVCKKIDYYISLVNPSQLVYIAFDGVAPVAKLHQQKTRRHKSHLEKQIKRALNPDTYQPGWNTAAITPGTQFMAALGAALRAHFAHHASKSGVAVVVSDSTEPGEGEHKIFADIRRRGGSDISVVYGLDSDLIMLTLLHLAHDPNLYLFRETPHFIKTIDKNLNPDEVYSLNIPKFSKIIQQKLGGRRRVGAGLANNQLIADYIFISFILGNDFVPHSPMLNIRTNGISYVMGAYRNLVDTDPSFALTSSRTAAAGPRINWRNFRRFVEILAKNEKDWLSKEYNIREKQHRKYAREAETPEQRYEVLPILERADEFYIDHTTPGWRHRYYKTLFDVDTSHSAVGVSRLKEICVNYLEALEWTFLYYCGGCPDQKWRYAHHYTPLWSDVLVYIPYFDSTFFDDARPPTAPISPYTQLAYVLPKPAWDLLPAAKRRVLERYDAAQAGALSDCGVLKWPFCKYLWEAHLVMPHIDIDALEAVMA